MLSRAFDNDPPCEDLDSEKTAEAVHPLLERLPVLETKNKGLSNCHRN